VASSSEWRSRAQAGSPKLLLADEPTGNLDTQMARGVMELVEGINADEATILLVTNALLSGRAGAAQCASRRRSCVGPDTQGT